MYSDALLSDPSSIVLTRPFVPAGRGGRGGRRGGGRGRARGSGMDVD
jgi:hypothetical protein